MPLIESASKKAHSENIRRLMDEGYPQKEAVAMAYDIARKNKKGSKAKWIKKKKKY